MGRGPITEEEHYYPFGLTMQGISSRALSFGKDNHYKFNGGNELEEKNFSDGSGLQWYDATSRSYDPQIGRFGQIDQLAEVAKNISPYVFANNNPIFLNDPLGLKADTNFGHIPDIVIKAPSKNNSVGQPGTFESAIPIWGSGRAAVDDFQNGHWGWGLFHTALAISDVFLVKAAVTGILKIGVTLAVKEIATEAIEQGTKIVLKDGTEIIIKDGAKMTEGEALEAGEKWLGEGYKDMGNGRYVSKDGLRQFRIGDSDILGEHAGAPHANAENLAPNPQKPGKLMVIDNMHLYFK